MRFFWNLGRAAAAALVFLALAAGCASDQGTSKSASSGNTLAAQARQMRSLDGNGGGGTFSERARDVEKDLDGH